MNDIKIIYMGKVLVFGFESDVRNIALGIGKQLLTVSVEENIIILCLAKIS